MLGAAFAAALWQSQYYCRCGMDPVRVCQVAESSDGIRAAREARHDDRHSDKRPGKSSAENLKAM